MENGKSYSSLSGNDITRVVKLKTQSGDLIRVVVKLRKLPFDTTAAQAFPSVDIVIKMT